MPIFDQGYQHWKGTLSGHAWRWLAIAHHGVRIGMQNRALRLALIVSLLPAFTLAAALCIWGLIEKNSDFVSPIAQFLVSMHFLSMEVVTDPKHYRTIVWTLAYWYFLSFELTISMVLVLIVGPNLISQDLRFNALPLYLSRPLRRIDYLAGKLGVIAGFLAFAMIVPSVLAYVLGLLFSLDWTILGDTWRIMLASLAYGVVIILSAGTLMLALSSLSRSSRDVALLWVGIWVVGNVSGWILGLSHQNEVRQAQVRQAMASDGKQRRFDDGYLDAQLETQKSDWRPIVSYTNNLSRIGRQLLGTDTCYEKLAELEPKQTRVMYRLIHQTDQYPWYWSAGVLVALFAISASILSLSVRSLDRLR